MLPIEKFEAWLDGKHAEVRDAEPLSIQANIAVLSQRLWAAEQQLEQVRRVCDKWEGQVSNPPLMGMVADVRLILEDGDSDE